MDKNNLICYRNFLLNRGKHNKNIVPIQELASNANSVLMICVRIRILARFMAGVSKCSGWMLNELYSILDALQGFLPYS